MDEFQNLTGIKTVSEDIFSVSKYLDVTRLPDLFNFAGTDTLPVIDREGKIVGIVSEFDLGKVAKYLSLNKESYRSRLVVENIMTHDVWVEKEQTDVLALFDKLEQMHIRFVPIVTDDGTYTGKCITRTKLINYLTRKIKPRTVAGVSTPLGIYLTDGLHRVGAKDLGLILNGVIFAFFIVSAHIMTAHIHNSLLASMADLFIFLVLFRLSSLSQIHASEHKVINAIEKGLPLDVETVQMQSRIHKRCGTNLLVLFLGIAFIFYVTNILIPKIWFLRFLISFVFLLGLFSYWKQIGFVVQEIFTTKEPTNEQVEKAIKVGEELMEASKTEPNDKDISFLTLLYTSGSFQIIVSFLIFFNILNLCLESMVK
jgi:CBS domain-containing protein